MENVFTQADKLFSIKEAFNDNLTNFLLIYHLIV